MLWANAEALFLDRDNDDVLMREQNPKKCKDSESAA